MWRLFLLCIFAADVMALSIPLPKVPLLKIQASNSTHTVFEDVVYMNCNVSYPSLIRQGYPNISLHCFNHIQPAPTIEMQPGKIFVLTLRNEQKPNYEDPTSVGNCWPSAGIDAAKLPSVLTPIGYLNNPHWSRTVNIHTHGLETSGYDDDIYIELNPGTSIDYEWTVPLDHPSGPWSGSFWWHSHAMGSTHTGAANGASGLLMMRDKTMSINPFAKEVLLQFHTLELNRLPDDPNTLGNDPLSYSCPDDGGYSANDFELIVGMINGVPVGFSDRGEPWAPAEDAPFVEAEANSLLFLRFSNAAARMMVNLGLEQTGTTDPLQAWLAEVDGIALEAPVKFEPGLPFAPNIEVTNGMLVSPASRLSVIVRLPSTPGATITLLMAEDNPSPFVPEGRLILLSMKSTPPLSRLPSVTDEILLFPLPTSLWSSNKRRNRFIEDSEIVRTRDISMQISGTYEGAPGPNPNLLLPNGYYISIDGGIAKPYEEMRMDIIPTLDTAEVWRVANPTSVAHGWHGHIFSFLITELLDTNGKNVMTTGSSFWSDTVYIPGGMTVVFKIRFFEFVGPFVAHCHLLQHEEAGLMLNVLVSKGLRTEPMTRGMIAIGMKSMIHMDTNTVSSSSFSPICSCSCDNLLAPLPAETYMGWRYNSSENAKFPFPLPRPYLFTGKLAEAFPIARHEHSRKAHTVTSPPHNVFMPWNGSLQFDEFVTLV